MLVHGAFGAVRLVTALDWALVVPLNLGCCSPVSLPLIVSIATTVIWLVIHRGQSTRHGCANISRHLGHSIVMNAVSYVVNFIHVVLTKGLDCWSAKHGLLQCTISTSAAASSASRLSSSRSLENCEVLVEGIRWCLILIFDAINQFLPLLNKLLIPVS